MGVRLKKEKEQLNLLLGSHLTTIHETLSSSESLSYPPKVTWDDVIKMSDQVSKQATTLGMHWTGEKLRKIWHHISTLYKPSFCFPIAVQ